MLRIQKRTALPVWKSWLIRAIAIIIALVLNGVLIYGLTKMNPVKVYATMFNGVFGTERRIWNTIRDISMLLCIGIGLAPAFKMKFWNIGAEGQILLGGIAAAACMMYFDSLPNGLLLVVMFLAAAAAGALAGCKSEFLRVRADFAALSPARRIEMYSQKLDYLEKHIGLLGVDSALNRGFAVAVDSEGGFISSAAEVPEGAFGLRFADGEVSVKKA